VDIKNVQQYFTSPLVENQREPWVLQFKPHHSWSVQRESKVSDSTTAV